MFKYIIAIAIFFVSCKNTEKSTSKDNLIFSKFPNESKIVFQPFIQYSNGIINRMFVKDTSLVVYDWRGTGGFFFYEYGLKSLKNINRYVPHGRGRGKALGSLSAGVTENSIWMYDISLSKILAVDIRKPGSGSDTATYKEYPFPQDWYNIQFLSDTKLIANGNYKIQNKLQEVDLASKKVVNDYGLIGDGPDEVPFYAWKRANEADMLLKPSKDKVVLAHKANDQIEIFDLKNHIGLSVIGPEKYRPEFSLFKGNDGQEMIQRNEKSRYAFGALAVTDKYIYALYSGNNTSTKYINYGKTLFIYDWHGNPVRKIYLDRYVCGFAISNDNKIIYAQDVLTKNIVYAKI